MKQGLSTQTQPSIQVTFLELVDGTQTNNIVKKKGTVLTHFQTKDGTLMEVKLSDVLFIPTVDILRTSSYKERL